MGKEKIKREIVAACIESPFYFTIPLKNRLELVKQFEEHSMSNLRRVFLTWVKTGVLSPKKGINTDNQDQTSE